jgi:hypothetical protein
VTFENSLSRNQIGDISMGGLSYYYEDHGFKLGTRSHALRVSATDHTPLEKVPFTIVSDHEAGSLVFKNKRIKRQGIRFGRMTMNQKSTLKKLIYRCRYKPSKTIVNASRSR